MNFSPYLLDDLAAERIAEWRRVRRPSSGRARKNARNPVHRKVKYERE
jgi:hypothetical protein